MKMRFLLLSASVLLLGSVTCHSREHHENEHWRPNHHRKTTPAPDYSPYPISLTVYNSLTNQPNITFTTLVAYRGILLGAMTRIQEANNGFNFTYTENTDYGPYLESVNGVAGSTTEQTYWELLVRTGPGNGKIIVPDVGIGCFIPEKNDNVILKYTTY